MVSNDHAVMSFGRLVAIHAEQPVPPWQIESVVAVGFAADDGVIYTVHIGRNDDISDCTINAYRKRYITIIENSPDYK